MKTQNIFEKAAFASWVIMAVSGAALLAAQAPTRGGGQEQEELLSTIAFVSTRDNPTINPYRAAEIYLMNANGTRRVTENTVADFFPAVSPDGKKIVFDSNRLRAAGEPLNVSDLFVMDVDGSELAALIRGSSPTWSPDSKNIAFHASASGTGRPIKFDPGAATTDSDIFVLNVDDVLKNVAGRTNLTNNPLAIDDDPDWSPDGQQIVFTSHHINDNPIDSASAEIYAINADGTGAPTRLTYNAYEERGPSWSPDGMRIVFLCRTGPPDTRGIGTFEICVMNANGTGPVQQLTFNAAFDGTPTFSPDGEKIVFSRNVAPGRQQLFVMNADGTGEVQLTDTPGTSLLANWGAIRVRGLQ